MRFNYFMRAAVVSLALQLSASAETADPSINGSVKLERWTGISGKSISLLTESANYPWSPSETVYLDAFENKPSLNNYGSRLRSFLTIPEDGEYTFYVAGDDSV